MAKLTETLTLEMVTDLRREAGAAYDGAMVAYCRETTNEDELIRTQARRICCDAINSARDMDDPKGYVRVTP